MEPVGMCRTPEQSNIVSSRAEANIDDDDGEHPPAVRATAAANAWKRDARGAIGLWIWVLVHWYTGTPGTLLM